MAETKPIGRPRTHKSGHALTRTLTFRMTDELYRQLEAASEENGRSLSGEVAFRLDASIGEDGLCARLTRIEQLLSPPAKLDPIPMAGCHNHRMTDWTEEQIAAFRERNPVVLLNGRTLSKLENLTDDHPGACN